MAANFKNISNGINLVPNSGSVITSAGDIAYNSSNSELELWTSGVEKITTNSNIQNLSHKSIDVGGTNAVGSTTISGATGTGSIVFSTSPTFSGIVKVSTIDSPAATVLSIKSAGTLAMTIDTDQTVLIGTTNNSPIGANVSGIALYADGNISISRSVDPALDLNLIGTGTISRYYSRAVQVGSVSVTGSTTAYNTSSDARLKDNVIDAPSALNLVDQIKVRSFDWKSDGVHQEHGFIAQELISLAPEAVYTPKNDGEMYAVDYSKLVPKLVKAIQELKAELDALKGK